MTADEEGGGQRLEFGILGPLEVVRSGTRLRLGGRQQRAILALLLCEDGKVVSVGRLADALWGERLPPGFLNTVQTYVFHLRELLDPERERGAASRVLVTEAGGGYRLCIAEGGVDALLFEDLMAQGGLALEHGEVGQALAVFDRALALWRGEVLSDLADFEFVAPVSGRLKELRLSALESRMEAELALGHHGTVIAELDRLVAENPMRERLHAERILALYRSGRQADALGAYRHLRTMLAKELGIEPSPPLRELHGAVLAQDPALAWRPPTGPQTEATGDGPWIGGGQVGSMPQLRPGPDLPAERPPGRFRDRVGSGLGLRAVAAWAVLVLVAAGGSVAAAVRFSGPAGLGTLVANSVGAVEPDGTISAVAPVGTNPVGLAAGAGALWVTNRSDGRVSRLDPATHAVVQTIDVGAAPEALTVSEHDVWVANFADDTVSRINIDTNRVVDTVAVGNGPAAIVSSSSGVWVANSGDNTIQRIDPTTGRAGTAIAVGACPDGIAADADSVWVANGQDGTLSRIDPKTGEEMSSPIRVGAGPKGIAIAGDDVWVANQLSSSVTRIKRSTGLSRQIEVGDGPVSVALAGGMVWVSQEFDGVLTRIDPATERIQSFNIGSSPRGLAAVDGRVWVASGAFAAPTHRGGTLTVASNELPGTDTGIDPANAYWSLILRPERLVYDGLVAFRLARGSDSQVLVPNLAADLPQPSNGGKTYTFTLRPGIKYSTGRQVHASDFRLGVARALTLKGGRPDFFAGIVGGQNCIDRPKDCDLSAGVLTDDPARRVSFHLIAPDPEFLYKLTYFVFPTPPGSPTKEVVTPLPGTGPYQIADYTRGKSFSLARNPFFHQWSFAAQPDGYPDAIRWLKVADARAQLEAVIGGRADVAEPDPSDLAAPSALVNDFKVRYPAQVHSDPLPGTFFEYLNTTVPPFNNVKARQGVSYAVDRNRLVELWGGPTVVAPTCQMLPPKFPGYSWHCPYTVGPHDGRYHGPDLVKARHLVEASGTKGMPVTIYVKPFPGFLTINAYFKQVLSQLGYKVTLHQMPPNLSSTDEFLRDDRNHVQVQMEGWMADFPLASNFYNALAACGAVENRSRYCNHRLDRDAAAATALASTDPGAALRAWAMIDKAVTDEAAFVPMFNLIATTFVSTRVGNYQSNPTTGAILSQLWVQ